MSDAAFDWDVFLSYSSKDGVVVRDIAERLRGDGVRVWLDAWEIRAGDHIQAKIEDGLERSRVLVLCMSAHAFGADWVKLEAGVFRFRDPLNRERRFIPLRLDEAPIREALAPFLYVDWRPAEREAAYAKLLEACRSTVATAVPGAGIAGEQSGAMASLVDQKGFKRIALASDGNRLLTSAWSETVRVWEVATGRCERVLEGHTGSVLSVAWSPDGRRALSGGDDGTVRVWEMATGRCERVLEGHTGSVLCVAWSADGRRALSGGEDQTVRVWEVATGRCERVLEGHTGNVWSVASSADGRRALSGGDDRTVRVWEVATGRCERVLEGHTAGVRSVAWSADGRRALSGGEDQTVRVWEVATGRCERVLEGHTGNVWSVAWSADGRRALSGGEDQTVRVWEVATGRCERVLEGHTRSIRSVAWSADGIRALSADLGGGVHKWDLSDLVSDQRAPDGSSRASLADHAQVQYTNAKVLLVGESGAGKTGLSRVLAGEAWEPSDSTVGAWATQWKLPVTSTDGVEREIWLWDFGGQADQRLIHQLYMDETALAVLVFDGQKEDLFETLGQWDRDLARASQKPFAKLLVAGRIDAGGLRASRVRIDDFARERGFTGTALETSAKAGTGCEALKRAIEEGIDWQRIPWRSSPLLFKHLKEEIVRLKDEGRVLMRFNELRDALQLRLSPEATRFTDDELRAVITLLAGPGVVWELKFGSWILLQPERINAYAQAVIQTMRADEHERGCLPEQRVLDGELTYHSSMDRLEREEERFVLLAMHQTLVERGLCLREHTGQGALLVFPSYYRRERPELVGHPAVLVSYRFTGFIDDVYATLVVRLHHTEPFRQDQLWRYAADFRTLADDRQLGVKLTRRAEGAGELEVYFDPRISIAEKIIFGKYVHEHLLKNARDVQRLRHYVCPHCGTPVANREVAMARLDAWLGARASTAVSASLFGRRGKQPDRPTIVCVQCEQRVPLWDDIEQHFASDTTKRQVRELEEQAAIVLDAQSKERALVGDVISTVALAGQIAREMTVADHGIDMEVEFKDDHDRATGAKIYLQLKSGDSHLRTRKSDGAEIFRIDDARHVEYWMAQRFPVYLVIRSSRGAIRWMEIRDHLRRLSGEAREPVKQIVFDGQRFDVMSVRRWRDAALSEPQPG